MLDNINNNPNDMTAWSKLLNYGNSMLLAPARGGKKRNLTSILKARSVTDHLPDPVLRVTKQRTTKTDLKLSSQCDIKDRGRKHQSSASDTII